jgi:hypothetical protein
MRAQITYISLILLFGLLSCRKEEVNIDNDYFIKVLDTPVSYYGQNAFQTIQGNIVLCSYSAEDLTSGDQYGIHPPIVAGYSSEGELEWTTEMPQIIHDLRKGIALDNGDLLFTGMDSTISSQQIGIVVTDSQGNIKTQHSFFNQTFDYSSLNSNTTIDCIQLNNGNIAMIVPQKASVDFTAAHRLLVFDSQLNVQLDRTYSDEEMIPNARHHQMSISESWNGELCVVGKIAWPIVSPEAKRAYVLKLEASNYDPISYVQFASSAFYTPSTHAQTVDQKAVWASSSNANVDASFNLRNQNDYYYGREITIWSSEGDSASTDTRGFTDFPKNAYIQSTRSTSDGGFILVGTCDINSNPTLASAYKILVIKVDQNLNKEWQEILNLSSPSLGFDGVETSAGYLICGAHLAIDDMTHPMIIQTNKNGKIQ